MSKLKFNLRPQRQALYIPMDGNRNNPSLVYPLLDVDEGQIDELVRAILQKQGITNEADVQKIIEAVEQSYEARIKVSEAKAEIRRLMKLKAAGAKLMSTGFRKWKEAFYPAVKQFKDTGQAKPSA
jgi:hypothetical protein